MEKNSFVEVFTGLCDMYNKQPSEFMFDIYYNIFKDYSTEQFGRAIGRCLENRVYNTIPKPAEILEYLEGTKDDRALQAWREVKEAIRKGGWSATIEFADTVIPLCIEQLGGWVWLCEQPKDDEPFIEKRFMDLYRLMLKRGETGHSKVIGYTETVNREKGYHGDIPEPIRIGGVKPKQIEGEK